MPSSSDGYRPRARIPRELHPDLERLAGEHGVSIAALAYRWIVAAYFAAIDGEVLPAPEPVPRHHPEVRWLQGQEQFAQCKKAIEGAGSTVGAVLADAARWWIAGGGGLDALRRPPRPRGRARTARVSGS